jgi:hypothetical protein
MYDTVIMGIQWIVRRSILLYLEGTVVPLKVIMGASSAWWAGLVGACVWNTKGALILSGCTFWLYSFVNIPFTVLQVKILYNGKFARCTLLKCYNAYCTLLGRQFNIHKFSIAPSQIYNFTWLNHHFHISTFTA